MRWIVLAALVVAAPAVADIPTFRSNDVVVRLSQAPCSPKAILALLQPSAVPNFRDAYVVYQGRELRACWRMDGASVLIVDEDGDAGHVPASAFKLEKGV